MSEARRVRLGPCVAVLFAFVAGCATQLPPVTVAVRSASDQQPLAGATVGWVCTPNGDGAAVSDTSGAANVVVFNSDPKQCVVTIAKIGYRTVQLVGQKLASLAVTLEPSQ